MTIATSRGIGEQIDRIDTELESKRIERKRLKRDMIQKVLDRKKRWEPEEIERSLGEELSEIDADIFKLEGEILAIQATHKHKHLMFHWVDGHHRRFYIDCRAPWPSNRLEAFSTLHQPVASSPGFSFFTRLRFWPHFKKRSP